MSQEFTIYTLFILLTVSMGIVFQFMLAKIKSLKATQKTIMKAMSGINRDLINIRNNKITGGVHKEPFSDRWKQSAKINKSDVLRGDLTLEYRGAKADTRATFMLDKD